MLIVLAVVGLGFGYVYKKTSGEVRQIVAANDTFYVTLKCEQVREYSVDAVSEGDIFYRRYDRQPMGPVVQLSVTPAEEILLKTDGTAVLAPMDDRYTIYVTLECSGNNTDAGYYINSQPIAEGSEFQIQSNKLLVNACVYTIGETLP